MPGLAAFPGMMERDRKGEGLRVCRAAWLLGLTVREYREMEAGERMPSLDAYRRISELYGWPQYVRLEQITARNAKSGARTHE